MSTQFLHGIETQEVDDGIRPISTPTSSVIGIVGTADDADVDLFPLDVPTLVTGPRMAAKLGAAGTLLDAYTAIYAEGANVAVVTRVAGAASAAGSAAEGTGVWSMLTAEGVTGLKPKILIAPGLSTPADPAVIPPVALALQSAASRLWAIAIGDGPNTTEAAALTYAGNFGGGRVAIADPHVRVLSPTGETVTRPLSASLAGAMAATDREKGFWHSPSNRILKGVTGTARPVSFSIGDPDTEANRLNAVGITTVVRKQGFRVWGNRIPVTDPFWVFLPVRRTADMVYEAVQAAHLWAMDRPFSAQLLRDIRDSVQAYLDLLTQRGATLGGRVWIDPELNTEATLKEGQLFIDFDFEPPAPLEHLIFRAHRAGTYYEELVSSAAA